MGNYSLRADEAPVGDRHFMEELNIIKDPFQDGLPKALEPVIVPQPQAPQPVVIPPKPVPVAPPVITLPTLSLQGVVVGEETQEAIINDKVIALHGTIEGAKVISVSKRGVRLLYKGKKFFLKVE